MPPCSSPALKLRKNPAFTVHIKPNAPQRLTTGAASVQFDVTNATTAPDGDATALSTSTALSGSQLSTATVATRAVAAPISSAVAVSETACAAGPLVSASSSAPVLV